MRSCGRGRVEGDGWVERDGDTDGRDMMGADGLFKASLLG